MGIFKKKSDLIHSVAELQPVDYSANPEVEKIYNRLLKGRSQFEIAMSKDIEAVMQISSLDLVLTQGTDRLLGVAGQVEHATSTILDSAESSSLVAAQVNDAEAPQIDIDDIEPFTLDNIQPEVPEDVPLSIGGNEVNVSQPDFVRFFGTELPDVNDLISDIFTAVSNENNTKKQEAEEDNSFRFTKIFDEPSDRGDTKLFNPKA